MTTASFEALRASPFFDRIADEDVAELAGRAGWLYYEAGERMFTEGEPATALCILVSGSVQLAFGPLKDAGDDFSNRFRPSDIRDTPSVGRRWSSPMASGLRSLPSPRPACSPCRGRSSRPAAGRIRSSGSR